MSLDPIRRLVISPVGVTLIATVGMYAPVGLVAGFNNPITIIMSLAFGLAFGNRFTAQYRKDNPYFVINVEVGRFSETRKYSRHFKVETMPNTKAERAEYHQYLEAMEKMQLRATSRKTLYTYAFILIMFALSVVQDPSVNTLNLLYLLIVVMLAVVYYRAKKTLEKIIRLKDKL